MENLKTCTQHGIFDCGCCVNSENNKNCKNYKPIATNTAYDELIYNPSLLAINYVKEYKIGNKIINECGDLKENTTREYCANLGNIFNSPSTSNTLISNAINSEHKPENIFNNNLTSNQIMGFISSSDNKELNKFLEFEDHFWQDMKYESQFLNENNAPQETTKEEKLSMSVCPVNSKYDYENLLHQTRNKFEYTPVEKAFDSESDANIIHQARNKLDDKTVEKGFRLLNSLECDENVLCQVTGKSDNALVEKIFVSELKNTPKIEDSKNEMLKTSNLTNSSGTSDEIDVLNIPDLANFVLKNVALEKVVDSGSEDLSKLYEPAQKISNLFNSPTTSEEINFINIPEFKEFLARTLSFAVQNNNYSDGYIKINNEINITSIAPNVEEFQNQPAQKIWNLIDLPSTSKQMSNMPDILENIIGKNMSTGGVSNIDPMVHKMLSNLYVNNVAHNKKKRLSKIEERRNKRRKKTQNFEAENEAVIFVGTYSNTVRNVEHNVIEISDSPTRVPVIDEIICLSDNESEKDERDSRLGECPVCLENFSTKDIMSTICGHIFCAECIKSAIKTTKKCPKCRKRLSLKRIHPLFI